MKKLDITLSLIAGFGVGLLFYWLAKNSNIQSSALILLPIILPVVSLFGIWLAYLIGKKMPFVYQLAKFVLIGAVFAIFDIIIFNAFLKWFGINQEEDFTIYTSVVALSFIIATSAKYVADKYWAFEKKEGSSAGSEFGKFFIVTLISGVIQVAIATFVFKAVDPILGMNIDAWGNIGKIVGIVAASAWNFIGYKFIVFKK